MLYSVDRFEGDWAVLTDENGGSMDVPYSLLPRDVREGDMLRCTQGRYEKAVGETRARRRYTLELQERIRKTSE